jgi:hypothetical protein
MGFTLLFTAVASACTAPGDYFIGTETPVEGNKGAQAYIDRYDPRACGASSAWALISSSANSNELAQDGWAKLPQQFSPPQTVFYFYEYGQPGDLYPPVAAGVVPEPKNFPVADHFTVYEKGKKEALFLINSEGIFNVELEWNPDEAQWYGEAASYSDQTPGDTNHHVEFYGTQHLHESEWLNQNALGGQQNTSPYGQGTWGNGAYMYIWDERFNSEY